MENKSKTKIINMITQEITHLSDEKSKLRSVIN